MICNISTTHTCSHKLFQTCCHSCVHPGFIIKLRDSMTFYSALFVTQWTYDSRLLTALCNFQMHIPLAFLYDHLHDVRMVVPPEVVVLSVMMVPPVVVVPSVVVVSTVVMVPNGSAHCILDEQYPLCDI